MGITKLPKVILNALIHDQKAAAPYLQPATYHYFGRNRLTPSKFKNRSCSCFARHALHQSIAEADHCNTLFAQKQAREIRRYETQVLFTLWACGKKITTHKVDFVVYPKGGGKEVHEVKGFETEEWKIKHRLFEANYPKIPYKILHAKGGPDRGKGISRTR